MIPKDCKRLAEVDFPIAVVSAHAAREKSIRHGHPSTLHLGWARRPLASCRAMLLALLLPDPCDGQCPAEFKEKARAILKGFGGVAQGDAGLRTALLGFIGDVANWDVANNARWIGAARDLVKAAHPEEPPLVVDPFAGGGPGGPAGAVCRPGRQGHPGPAHREVVPGRPGSLPSSRGDNALREDR